MTNKTDEEIINSKEYKDVLQKLIDEIKKTKRKVGLSEYEFGFNNESEE